MQEVQTTIALNYHISPSQANFIYQQLGADYADTIIATTVPVATTRQNQTK
ncbi:MAG: hypothetical protein WAM42_21380 [Candidatus Nitrosopolaris sp.]